MKLKLYYHPISQPCRAVLLLIKLLKLDAELIQIDLFNRSSWKNDYQKKVNPIGVIPAIDDEGFILSESHSILRYLSQKANAENWYPTKDLRMNALVNQRLDFHLSIIRNGASPLQYYLKVLPFYSKDFTTDKETEIKIQMAQTKLNQGLSVMNQWLQDSKWLAGDQPTIADLSTGCELAQLEFIRFDFSSFPNVKIWYERVIELPHFEEVSVFIRELSKKMNSNN